MASTQDTSNDIEIIWTNLVATMNRLGYGPLLGARVAFYNWAGRYVVLIPPEDSSEEDESSEEEESDNQE